MKKSRLISMILAVLTVFSIISPAALAVGKPELSSSECVIIGEPESGDILFEKNSDEKREPASLTKMMTLLLAVEAVEAGKVSLSDTVTASKNCRSDLTDDSSNAQIYSGERMSLNDLLYCAALASANEACNIIAEYLGGSIPEFVGMMNRKAEELGCKGTHFANTHGLPDENHYSTARDLYTIACEGMRHGLFRELVGTAEHTAAATNASSERALRNSNALICQKSPYGDDYFYEDAVGIKTGHTNNAGFCLASCAVKNGVTLIAVVLGAKGDMAKGEYFDNFADSRSLLDWAFTSYRKAALIIEGENLGTHAVSYGERKGEMQLSAGGSIECLLPKDTDLSAVKKELELEHDGLVPEGHKVGTLTLRASDGKVYGTVPVISGKTVLESPEPVQTEAPDKTEGGILSVWENMDYSHQTAIVLMLAVILVFIFVVIFALKRRRKQK